MAKRFIDVKELQNDLKKALKDVAKQASKTLHSPTETWEHEVKFTETEPRLSGGDLVSSSSTTDDPYFWLDGGTNVRHAAMTSDFVPKTQPGSFSAGAGAGGVAWRSKKINMPGIDPREWTIMASLIYEKRLQDAIDQVLDKIDKKGSLFALTSAHSKYVIDE